MQVSVVPLANHFVILSYNPLRMATVGPWGTAFGPLRLTTPLHELLKGTRKNLPKFLGDGAQHPDEHIVGFYIACGVLGVEHEDVYVRLFIETLQGAAVDWFYHLPNNCITNWASLRTLFEARFKFTENDHALLAQLTQMKKEPQEPMREFVAKFNNLHNRIPTASQPIAGNLKCFFINAQLPEVSFLLRRDNPAVLAAAQ